MKHVLSLFCVIIMLASCKNTTNNTTTDSDAVKDSLATVELAKNIHKRIITLDTHCDINVKNFTDSINYTQRLDTQVNLPKMDEGALDVVWLVVYTWQDTLSDEGYAKAYDNAISKFDAIHNLVEKFNRKHYDVNVK